MEFESCLACIGQPVVILDKLRQVIYMNGAFEALFPRVELSENLNAFTGDYPILLPLLGCAEGVYPLQYGGRYYSACVSFARYGKRSRPAARCVLFFDETETVELLNETRQQGELLRQSNEKIF